MLCLNSVSSSPTSPDLTHNQTHLSKKLHHRFHAHPLENSTALPPHSHTEPGQSHGRRDSSSLHLAFVYGTLKQGFGNHWLMEELMDSRHARFVGGGFTSRKFPLVCGPFQVPFLLHTPSPCGHHVRGEVYEIDEFALSRLDELEGISKGHYERRLIDVVVIKPGCRDEDDCKDDSTIMGLDDIIILKSGCSDNEEGDKGNGITEGLDDDVITLESGCCDVTMVNEPPCLDGGIIKELIGYCDNHDVIVGEQRCHEDAMVKEPGCLNDVIVKEPESRDGVMVAKSGCGDNLRKPQCQEVVIEPVTDLTTSIELCAHAYFACQSYSHKMASCAPHIDCYTDKEASTYVPRKDRPANRTFLEHVHAWMDEASLFHSS